MATRSSVNGRASTPHHTNRTPNGNNYPNDAGIFASLSTSPLAMEPVAIIGMSIRFPGDATSPDAFWDMLVAGRSAWSEIPTSRFNIDAWYHENPDRIDAVSTSFPQVERLSELIE